MNLPAVSVVMGVYNGANDLGRTLDSVLTQQGVDLEFIVVNDGSSDETSEILGQRAQEDLRLRVFHQPNRGLTAALVRGCEEARGEFIARQDAGGDLSLPGRFKSQTSVLRVHPDAILTTCATRYVAPDGDLLFDKCIEQEQLERGLRTLTISGVIGPSSHGSCLFRREAYFSVGGYRPAFTLAQDLDLWLRMIEIGRFVATDEVLYEACWMLGGLTSRLRPEQIRYAEIALEAAQYRRKGLPEPDLPEPQRSVAIRGATARGIELADFHYYIGSCVAKRDPGRARKHFWNAVKAHPLHFRAMLRSIIPNL